MSDLKFTEDHEWISVDGDVATVGITEHAQEQLGDVVFVDLPAVGTAVTKGGDAVSAVPAEVVMETFVRGRTLEGIVDANRKVDRAVRGAAGGNFWLTEQLDYFYTQMHVGTNGTRTKYIAIFRNNIGRFQFHLGVIIFQHRR